MLINCPNCAVPFPYKRDRVYTENTILVEGADDEMLILALVRARGLNINDPTVEAKDGYSSILSRLVGIKQNSGFTNIKKLLVVADANSAGIQVRFQEIVSKLDPGEFSLPTNVGLLSNATSNKKQCGIFLFPDNINTGTIEDLCLKANRLPTIYPLLA